MKHLLLILGLIIQSFIGDCQVITTIIPSKPEISKKIFRLDTLNKTGVEIVESRVYQAIQQGFTTRYLILDEKQFVDEFYSSIRLKNKKQKIKDRNKNFFLRIIQKKNERFEGLSSRSVKKYKDQLISKANGNNILIVTEIESEKAFWFYISKRITGVIEIQYELYDPQMNLIKGGSVIHKIRLSDSMDPAIFYMRFKKAVEEMVAEVESPN